MLERDRGAIGTVGTAEYGARRQIPAICSYMNASWYNVAVTSYFHESRTKPTKPGPVSASRRGRAVQGVKRLHVRSGATVARRKFQPRLGRCGCGGNSTCCGLPFLWLLSFGNTKERSSPAGRDPRTWFWFCFWIGTCVGDVPSKYPLTRMMISCRFRAADGERAFAWPKAPSDPKSHPPSMACGTPPGPVSAAAWLELAIG